MAKKKRSPFLYVYIYSFIILIGHTIPLSKLAALARVNDFFEVIFSDETFHFILFGFLAWLLCFGFFMAGRKKIPYVRIFVLSMAYGFLIEAWQALIPYRHFDKRDMVVDFAGIVTFMIGFWVMKRWGILLKQEKHT